MGQDLREMFKKEHNAKKYSLKEGHEARFIEKLDAVLPVKKKNLRVFKMVASLLLLFGLGTFAYLQLTKEQETPTTVVSTDEKKEERGNFSLGDLSPDLMKVENYYIANINLELAKLKVSNENKDIVDSFMAQLSELNDEYELLTIELNEMGPNDQTITALIENLQLRLQLLQRLKKKLNQLKSSKNEQINSNSI